jgi:hypothetical protein
MPSRDLLLVELARAFLKVGSIISCPGPCSGHDADDGRPRPVKNFIFLALRLCVSPCCSHPET